MRSRSNDSSRESLLFGVFPSNNFKNTGIDAVPDWSSKWHRLHRVMSQMNNLAKQIIFPGNTVKQGNVLLTSSYVEKNSQPRLSEDTGSKWIWANFMQCIMGKSKLPIQSVSNKYTQRVKFHKKKKREKNHFRGDSMHLNTWKPLLKMVDVLVRALAV